MILSRFHLLEMVYFWKMIPPDFEFGKEAKRLKFKAFFHFLFYPAFIALTPHVAST